MGNVCCIRSVKKVGLCMKPYQIELQVIKETVKKVLAELKNQEKEVEVKDNKDLVTIYDKTIEQRLIDAILKKYPTDHILSEETHQFTPLDGRCWIIDPIDGTTNFVVGLPLYCIQVALYEYDDLQLSYLYLPVLDKEYTAVKGHGATLNGVPIKTLKHQTLSNSLASFVGLSRNPNQLMKDALNQTIDKNMKIRTLGSVGVELAFVAEGISMACYTNVKNIWDIAPGILLCKEAGAYNPINAYEMGIDPLFIWGNKEAYELFKK